MWTLVSILWIVYLSECVVRWRPGDWIFRAAASGPIAATGEADITFLDGRLAFAWTTLLPWRPGYVFSGDVFDEPGLRLRLNTLDEQLTLLRHFASGLFAVVLVALPALVLADRLSSWSLVFAAAFLLAWAGTFVCFFVTHRRVHGSRPVFETWVVMAVSPLSLIRAPHAIAFASSPRIHPVAAAAAVCGDEEFLRVARLWHFDAPEMRSAIESLARTRGVHDRLLAPPAATEPGVTRFCRRCHATFRDGASACADCEGVELTALAPVPTDGPSAAG